MVQRIQHQQSNELVAEIQGIITDFDALKTSEQRLGSDSIVINLVKTGNTWDINQSIAAYGSGTWRVTFVPKVMKNPFTELTYNYQTSGGTGYEVVWFVPDVAYTSSTQSSWDFNFSADANSCTVQVVFGIKCPDTGTLTITRTA